MMKNAMMTSLLSLSLAITGFADNQPADDADLNRNDPKIAKALREPIALGPLADDFKEALHTEEVARDLDAAAGEYATILKKWRAKETGGFGAGVASLSLFRLAEIRRKQGRQEEARKHVAGYKVPRELHIVEEIPRAPSGKPAYPKAREIALSRDNLVA